MYIYTKSYERRPISINVCTNTTGFVSTVYPKPIQQYI